MSGLEAVVPVADVYRPLATQNSWAPVLLAAIKEVSGGNLVPFPEIKYASVPPEKLGKAVTHPDQKNLLGIPVPISSIPDGFNVAITDLETEKLRMKTATTRAGRKIDVLSLVLQGDPQLEAEELAWLTALGMPAGNRPVQNIQVTRTVGPYKKKRIEEGLAPFLPTAVSLRSGVIRDTQGSQRGY